MEVPASHPLNGQRVLVADDEIFIALDMECALREAGADVVGPCATLTEALRAANEELISIAVLDIRLGRDTTDAVASVLRGRDIPYLCAARSGYPLSILQRPSSDRGNAQRLCAANSPQ